MVSFELAVARVEMSVFGKSKSLVHQPMERSYPSVSRWNKKSFFFVIKFFSIFKGKFHLTYR
jgi:hypothetical protein